MQQIQSPPATVVSQATIQPALLSVLSKILSFGAEVDDERGNTTKELRNVTVTVEKPWIWNLDNLVWGNIMFRPKWADREFMKAYDLQASATTRNGHPYVYGTELRAHPTLAYVGDDKDDARVFQRGHAVDQISEYIVPKLVESLRTRRAVGFTWNVAEFSDLKVTEVPCLDMIQVLVRPDKSGTERLHITGYLRSNEMYSAWAADVSLILEVQEDIISKVHAAPEYGGPPLGCGSITTVSGSAHIYKENWADAGHLLMNMGMG